MANFISIDKVTEIFGENLLDKKEMINYFLDLLGKTDNKPFECVGTIDEVTFCVNNIIKNSDEKLPYLLKYYKENYDLIEPNNDMLKLIDSNNNVPKELLDLIKEELYND